MGDDATDAAASADADAVLRELAARLDQLRAVPGRRPGVAPLALADAAHQLRNPLAGVHACAEALLHGPDGVDGADTARLFADLVRETSRVGRLYADLCSLARLEGGVALRRAEVDLVAVCQSELARMWSLAPRLDIALRATQARCLADVDEHAVREILANLLDNARRHARRSIEVDVTATATAARLSVRDDGGGVAATDAGRIFDRFVSLDGRGGTGLGLPVARDLARAHGGDLTLTDGAFVVELPRPGGGG